MSEEKGKTTSILNLPPAPKPAPDRPAGPMTVSLTEASYLLLKFTDKSDKVKIAPKIVFGRKIEGSEDVDYDLTAYGAYQSGVSRRHAMISLLDGSLYIEDLGSTNGTRINGAQMTAKRKYRLRDGDEIEMARLRFIIRFEK